MLKRLIFLVASFITLTIGGDADPTYTGWLHIHITDDKPVKNNIQGEVKLFSFEL